jgi:hypothetical protein
MWPHAGALSKTPSKRGRPCAAIKQRDSLERQISGRTFEDDVRDQQRTAALADEFRRRLWGNR